MKIVLIGATGTIGKGIATLLKEKGHEVIEASRSSQPKVDLTEPLSLERFFDHVGEVDAIITAAGSAAFVAVDKITAEDIQLSLHSKLMGQINAVRKGLKKLKPNGVVVITGGILAYE
ncbi:MAG: NAD-dependent epimerase/dehydratase family protein, partial [Sphingobacteriales bacterium]